VNITIQPIDVWPGTLRGSRSHSQFKATYSQTVELLERELAHLQAHSVALQLAVRPREIRADGQMRADARPEHPGVVLRFTGKHGHVTMPCDKYAHWHENLRALALSLEALRAVDRYGVTTRGEQYKGWKALPGAIEMGPATMTVEEAAAVLVDAAAAAGRLFSRDSQIKEAAMYRDAYRMAAKKLHPDTGGNRAAWDRLQAAAAALNQHHGIK
jgi:hypothetical protein